MAQETKGLVLQQGGDTIDTVVLACTHFPLLTDELRAAFGEGITFLDGSEGIARRIVALTQGQAFERSRSDFAVTTGDLADFKALAPAFAAQKITRLERF